VIINSSLPLTKYIKLELSVVLWKQMEELPAFSPGRGERRKNSWMRLKIG